MVSASDMAVEGVRLARQWPRAILLWTLVYFLLTVIAAAVLVVTGGEGLEELNALQRRSNPDPEDAMAALGKLVDTFLLLIPLVLAFYGVLYAAVYRAEFRPEEGGPGFLRLGADEVRQALVYGAYVLILACAYIVFFIVGALLVGGLAAVGVRGVLPVMIAIALGLAGMLFLGVRLSLGAPMTFDERRFRLFQSWRLTAGHFWPLLGGYVLAWLISIVVLLAGNVIFFALAALFGGGLDAVGRALSPNYGSLGEYFTPLLLINALVNSLLYVLVLAMAAGAPAEAYQRIRRASPATSPANP